MNKYFKKEQFAKSEPILRKNKSPLPIPGKDELLICPVGGVGKIGMNWTLYGHDGHWILVDAGLDFPDKDEALSIEAIFPDPTFLPKLSALLVTHAHEDHIGSIHRIWPQINCDIYATPFATEIISNRMKAENTLGNTKFKVFQPGSNFRINGLEILAVPLTHSVPECVGFFIQTSAGNVFHTGDWKFDDAPVVGHKPDYKLLERISNIGVTTIVCDSTNAQRSGRSFSEGELRYGFEAVMRDFRRNIVISCFATNVARLKTIMQAADATHRYVSLRGASMMRTKEAARACGMLDNVHPTVSDRFLSYCDPCQRVIVCTGTQGEERAALAKLSRGERLVDSPIKAGDVVIHSARAIPGNEEDIQRVMDGLRGRGAIILDGDYKGMPLHVTGHAQGAEIARMFDLVKPKIVFPVHGDTEQMNANLSIAAKAGVKEHVLPESGGLYRLNNGTMKQIDQFDVPLQCQLTTRRGNAMEFTDYHRNPVSAQVMAI